MDTGRIELIKVLDKTYIKIYLDTLEYAVTGYICPLCALNGDLCSLKYKFGIPLCAGPKYDNRPYIYKQYNISNLSIF